jgi:hypothetical protein
MKAARHRLAVLALCLVCGFSHAEDPAKVHTTIERGLQFLTKAGDAWMAEQNCVSCHHMGVLIRAQAEAMRRGFKVDQTKLDEWTDWTLMRLDGKSKPGVEALSELILAVPAAGPQLQARLIKEQQADGTWKPGGQFATMQQRTTSEAQEATTRLSLLALLAVNGDAPAREKALAKLGPATEADSTETLVWRALLAKGQKSNPALAEMLRRQNADGGWAWRTGEWVSDALATGEVLAALKDFPGTKPAADRARAWLVANQAPNGSWPIDASLISQLSRKDFTRVNGIYTFWGTAWATIGLLQDSPQAGVASR